MQRQRHPQGHRLRLADGEGLGHLLADDDVQRGEDEEADDEADRVQQLRIDAGRHQHRLEQRGDRRLAQPAEAQRRHGDAELAGGQIGLELLQNAHRQLGPGATCIGHRHDARPADLDQRELGGDEKSIGGQEQHDADGRKHDAMVPSKVSRSQRGAPSCPHLARTGPPRNSRDRCHDDGSGTTCEKSTVPSLLKGSLPLTPEPVNSCPLSW